jgi:hypothetical protein
MTTTQTSLTTTFSTQLIGRTEKTLSAILDRQLQGTGLDERLWVTLTVTATAGPLTHDALIERIANVFKRDQNDARQLLAALLAAGLLEQGERSASIAVSGAGRRLVEQLRDQIGTITTRLWGDLPPADLATTGRVLATVLARAEAEVAGG